MGGKTTIASLARALARLGRVDEKTDRKFEARRRASSPHSLSARGAGRRRRRRGPRRVVAMARDKKPSSRRCPYDVLSLPAKARATGEEIRKAYHRLARVHHPDKARTDEERERATIAFKEIGAAYELLSDPAARARYDREGHAPEPMDPREAEAEERHARRMFCAALGIPETVVRECWCTLEELYSGTTRREGVMVATLTSIDRGCVPGKEAKVFNVRIAPGWRDGHEIRFGALRTNNLQSVTFVVRELRHARFTRGAPREVRDAARRDAAAAHGGEEESDRHALDVTVWCALTRQVRSSIQKFFTHRSVSTLDRVPFQLTGEHFFCVWNGPQEHARGAVVAIPTLTPGRELKLSVKPGSAVVASGGTKTMRGEGFVLHHHAQHHPGGGGAGVTARRGDLHVRFRVMNALEQWLKADAARMRAARRAGYVAGGVVAAYATLRALAWVVEVRSPYTGSHTAASAW